MTAINSRRPIRVVCGTIKDGSVNFNQVVMEREDAPEGVLLVGIDPDSGLAIWLTAFAVIAREATTQIDGYSRHLRFDVADPPDSVGEPVFVPAAAVEAIRAGLWDEILEANTNTKNKLVREAFSWF